MATKCRKLKNALFGLLAIAIYVYSSDMDYRDAVAARAAFAEVAVNE